MGETDDDVSRLRPQGSEVCMRQVREDETEMSEMREYKFIIPGKPVGKQSARTFTPKRKDGTFVMKHGKPLVVTTTPEKSRNFHAVAVQMAANAGIQLMEYAILEIVICIPCRLKKYKTKADVWLEPKVRPDRDNVKKIIQDSLQGIAYMNDKNTLDGRTVYEFLPPGSQPFTEVTVTETHWHKNVRHDKSLMEGSYVLGE